MVGPIESDRVRKMLRTLLGLILAVVLVPSAWAQSSYRIQAGDVLQMEVLEDPSLNRSLLVLPDGTVSLPLVGAISASGKSVDTMRSAIASALAAPSFSSHILTAASRVASLSGIVIVASMRGTTDTTPRDRPRP